MSRHTPFNPVDDYNIKVQQAKTFLGFSPTADVHEVSHAKFELVDNGKGICSNCHRLDYIDNLAKYCRYCGAKIDVERRSENGTP